jgi:glycine/D-amino acid oxidase-like deaminating enzyme
MADIRTDKLNKQSASVCVVGGGIIGSWTALHLAEAGVNTTLVEQFPLPHTRGSSHGLSRAFRFLGELELDRLDYSLSRWQALEKASGETLSRQACSTLANLQTRTSKHSWQYCDAANDLSSGSTMKPLLPVFRC